MFGNINTIIPKTMPTLSGCAFQVIVERMRRQREEERKVSF